MTLTTDVSGRDQQALDAATASGDLPIPSPAWCSELSAERGVSLSLARHLSRISGAMEAPISGATTSASFVFVTDEWPTGTDPARYPSATILPMGEPETTVQVRPYRTGPVDAEVDLISVDGQWALWVTGEDTGTMIVHVFAASRPQRNAMQTAVEKALEGSLDRLRGLALPLPEFYLPPPFRRLLDPAAFPKAYVAYQGSMRVGDAEASASGIWRADITLTWQALRVAARPRLPDLRASVAVLVGPPGQEVK